MDENLQTLRALHRLLMGVCVAIIIFSIPPSREKEYSSARNELKHLENFFENFKPRQYHSYVLSIIDSISSKLSLKFPRVIRKSTGVENMEPQFLALYPTANNNLEKIRSYFFEAPPLLVVDVVNFDMRIIDIENRETINNIFVEARKRAGPPPNTLGELNIKSEFTIEGESILKAYFQSTGTISSKTVFISDTKETVYPYVFKKMSLFGMSFDQG